MVPDMLKGTEGIVVEEATSLGDEQPQFNSTDSDPSSKAEQELRRSDCGLLGETVLHRHLTGKMN
jgi:hypothetical protein